MAGTDIYFNKICSLLGYYAASSGKPLPTFWDNLSVPYSRVKKMRPMLSGNVGKGLPLDAA